MKKSTGAILLVSLSVVGWHFVRQSWNLDTKVEVSAEKANDLPLGASLANAAASGINKLLKFRFFMAVPRLRLTTFDWLQAAWSV